jgi:hypothetical protein
MHALTDHRYAGRRRLVVALTTFLLVSTFVIRASDAAFETSYTNEASTLATGSLELDSPATTPLFGNTATAMFRGTDLNAGESTTGCIDIELTTSLDPEVLDDVTFEVEDGYEDDRLVDDLTIAVQLLDDVCPLPADLTPADGTVFGGDLADARVATATDWNPTGDDTRGFVISVTVADTAAQGASVSDVDLTWRITTTNS